MRPLAPILRCRLRLCSRNPPDSPTEWVWRRWRLLLFRLCLLPLVVFAPAGSSLGQSRVPLSLSWSNNLLLVSNSRLPGGKLEIWYLEAFCRGGAWTRNWRQTTLHHTTRLTVSTIR